THELVLATRVARRRDDRGAVLRAEPREQRVQAREELSRAVTHDGDEVRAFSRLGLALLERRRELQELALHLLRVVLARQHEIHAVLAHQAAGGRARATV